jgi:hypothetical protein
MEETLRTHLLELARRFQEATKVTPSTVGKRALNDNTVFGRLEAAEIGFGVRTYDRLVQYFSDHWPDDAEWPVDVTRPVTTAQNVQAAE